MIYLFIDRKFHDNIIPEIISKLCKTIFLSSLDENVVSLLAAVENAHFDHAPF